MSYTFLDQQNKLSALLGDSNTGTTDMWPLAQRKKELNRGELQFARDGKLLRQYATGTVANKQLDIPSDWIETFALYVDNKLITNDRELSVQDLERYANYGGDIPFYYFWEFSGTRRYTFVSSASVNGKTYKLYYFRKPTTELAADTDTALVPEEYREAAVYYAAAELLRQISKMDVANLYLDRYAIFVRKAQTDISQQHLLYLRPQPDFNLADTSVIDVQGGGYWGS